MPMRIQEIGGSSHERVTRATNDETGLDAIIAIHTTKPGPADGGTRLQHYDSFNEHLEDVLKLSSAMTLKCKAADLPHGGGKAVINYNGTPTRELLEDYAVFLNFMNKDGFVFQTGGDMNIGNPETEIIAEKSRYCYHHPFAPDSGETTAYGVMKAIMTVAKQDKPINIEGLGKVGERLAHMIRDEGYKVRVSDIDEEKAMKIAYVEGYEYVSPDKIRLCDGVYAPCARGGTITEEWLRDTKATVVCGGANNQLCCPEIEQTLNKHDIVYVPDYIANMGGIIHCIMDQDLGYPQLVGIHHPKVRERLDKIPTKIKRYLTED